MGKIGAAALIGSEVIAFREGGRIEIVIDMDAVDVIVFDNLDHAVHNQLTCFFGSGVEVEPAAIGDQVLCLFGGVIIPLADRVRRGHRADFTFCHQTKRVDPGFKSQALFMCLFDKDFQRIKSRAGTEFTGSVA